MVDYCLKASLSQQCAYCMKEGKTNEITDSSYARGLDLYIYRCREHLDLPCLHECIGKAPKRGWENRE